MRMPATLLTSVVALSLLACASGENQNADTRAQKIWQDNMAIVDASIAFWRAGSGTARYSLTELEKAISFFETLTDIQGIDISYVGPLPDEQLEQARAKWSAWYAANCGRLAYDGALRRVVVTPATRCCCGRTAAHRCSPSGIS